MGGHLITFMNHSQIAPVQQDSEGGAACPELGAGLGASALGGLSV